MSEMISKILVPLDGSLLAESVLPHVAGIGRATNAQVTLLHVIDSSPKERDRSVDVFNQEMLRAEAAAYLDDVVVHLGQLGISAQRLILEGRAAQKIANYVGEERPDLLVFSSHGESGLEAWNLSGVVQKVIQVAKTSLLLVRAYQTATKKPARVGYHRLMIPLDGSLRAEFALVPATIIAKHWDAELLLTHIVVRPPLFSHGPVSNEDTRFMQRFVERNLDAAAKYLAQVQARLPARSRVRLRVSENILGAFQGIMEADEVELMICTAHGHGCHHDQRYGGLVNSCLHYCSVPILVIQDLKLAEIEMTQAEVIARSRQWEDTRQLRRHAEQRVR